MGMASGVVCGAGARHFALRLEACPHERVQRCVFDRHAVRPPQPLAQRLLRGETLGTLEGLLQAGEYCWRVGDRFARGDVGGQQRLQAPGGIACQPAADRRAVDAQSTHHILAILGLPSRQQLERVYPQLCLAVMFMV
jgi:hypothetical protein